MALTQQIDRIDTIVATAAITAGQFVGYDGAVCAANAKALGVAVYDADIGDNCSVAVEGRYIVTAGGAVAVGDAITSDATGKAVVASALGIATGATTVLSTAANGAIVTGGVAPVAINGYARTAAATSGDLIEIELK